MIVLMIVGAVTLPLLNVQYHPTTGTNNVTVSFSYMASARVVENEVTSLVEGVMNTFSGVSDTRAVSYNGGGYVSITFKKGTDIETARFDVSTRLRQIRDRLPQGVYPSVGGSISGRNNSTTDVLSYTVNADMPAQQILEYVEKNIGIRAKHH
jgi:multidrug efflux pump subunit AcrB